jgi:acyl-CoA thioesterase-1
MKRNLIIVLVVVLLLITGFIVFNNRDADFAQPTTGENIIIFGDSLAFGFGSTANHDLASILRQKTGLPVINAGVNGDTTLTSAARLSEDVLSKNPKVVIILVGGNDFFQRIPPETTMASLRTIIDEILKTGSGIILVNENKIFATTPEFRKLANEKQIPYIENILDGIVGESNLMYDQIHPNDAGYELMAEKIVPVLQDYID